MTVSARAVLAAGVVALTGAAVAFTPAVLPATMTTVEVRPVSFAADSTPHEPTAGEVRAALELIGALSPVRPTGTVTVTPVAERTAAAPVINRVARSVGAVDGAGGTADGPLDAAAVQAVDDPVALNAASDLINGVYSISRYWANYVSLELGPWLINWIPFGYLVSDQIYIWYPDFVLPVVDSFVYDFLDPVVNDPLNLGVWLNGIGDIINTAVTGVYNGIVSEIQYVLSFGWFPIPLPPLPSFPLPSAAVDTAPTDSAALSTEAVTTVATSAETGAGTAEPNPVGTDPEPVGEEPTAPVEEPTEPVEQEPTAPVEEEQTGEDAAPVEQEPTGEDTTPIEEPTGEDTTPIEEPTGEDVVGQDTDPGTAAGEHEPAQDGAGTAGAPAAED